MLAQGSERRLWHYKIPIDENGVFLLCPYKWPFLNLSPDMGPDMVCMDHVLQYKLRLNINTDYDPSHQLHNQTRGGLRGCGLWLFFVLINCAQNCTYGSTFSPPRLQALMECFLEHMEHTTADNDHLYQMWEPWLACMA